MLSKNILNSDSVRLNVAGYSSKTVSAPNAEKPFYDIHHAKLDATPRLFTTGTHAKSTMRIPANMNWSNAEQKPSLFKTLIDSGVKYETAERILADHADLISYIDVLSLSSEIRPGFKEQLELGLHKVNLLRNRIEHALQGRLIEDKTDVRSKLYDIAVKPSIETLSDPIFLKTIIDNVVNDSDWLETIAAQSYGSDLGFSKIIVTRMGGLKVQLVPEDIQANGGERTEDEYPEVELRLHFFDKQDKVDKLHKHGFDMYSRILDGHMMDQQYVAVEHDALSMKEKRFLDAHQCDLARLDTDVVTSKRYLDYLDLETSGSDNEAPDQDFRYYVYNYRSDDSRSPDGLEKGLIHYKPAGYGDLRLYPLKPQHHYTGSVRFHPSENPHAITGYKGTRSLCFALFRPGETQKFISQMIIARPDDELPTNEFDETLFRYSEPMKVETVKSMLRGLADQVTASAPVE